jgi:hypothetical protein
MRILFAIACVSMAGCATTLGGGAQATYEPAVGEEAVLPTGAGLGDGSAALLFEGKGTLGVDVRTGKTRGSAQLGYEWLTYGGGDFETVRHGTYFGIYGGARLDDADRGLVYVEFGHAWVIARRPPGDENGYSVTALTLAPMIGVTLHGKEQVDSNMMIGLGLGVRTDTFSSWKFHL